MKFYDDPGSIVFLLYFSASLIFSIVFFPIRYIFTFLKGN